MQTIRNTRITKNNPLLTTSAINSESENVEPGFFEAVDELRQLFLEASKENRRRILDKLLAEIEKLEDGDVKEWLLKLSDALEAGIHPNAELKPRKSSTKRSGLIRSA